MAIDHARVERAQCLVVDAQLLRGGIAQVVMDDVGPTHQSLEHLTCGRLLEIEREAALSTLAAREDALHAAHLVARGGLELDHVGPEVRHEHGCDRAGQEIPQVQHLHSGERRASLLSLAPLGQGAALSLRLRPDG